MVGRVPQSHKCDLPEDHLSINDVIHEVNVAEQECWLNYHEKIMKTDFRVVARNDGKTHFWDGIDHSFCYTWACGGPNTCKEGTVFYKLVPPHVSQAMICKSCLEHKVVTRTGGSDNDRKRPRGQKSQPPSNDGMGNSG